MANDKMFKVAAASLSELEKYIQGYAHFSAEASLDEIANLLSTDRTEFSRSNPFLVAVGLIEGGQKKKATELGRKLGRALEHGRDEEAKEFWRQVVTGNEFLADLVSTVRLKGGMSAEDLASHALFVADQTENRRTKTGAKAVVDLLSKAGFLEEREGKLQVVTATYEAAPSDPPPDGEPESSLAQTKDPLEGKKRKKTVRTAPSIAINIQLHLPETENPVVYESLFKALREHLLDPADNGD